MTKTIDHDLRYDGASAEQVYAMLADPTFREEVCDAQGVLRHDITITPAGDTMEVTVDQVQTATGIPSFAKKFVGEEINIVQKEQWSSPAGADIEVSIPGKPGDMRGMITLVEDDGGTTENVRMDVKVAIPLLGGKIEGLIADLLTRALKAENRVGRKHLGA